LLNVLEDELEPWSML